MARTNFENLRIYHLSEALADEIWNIASAWKPFAKDTLGKQIVRAADSVGANIAEGSGRGSSQDNRRFIRMARGSLCETQHWLRRAFKRNLLTSRQVDKLKPLIDELSPKINSYLHAVSKTVESQRKGLTLKAKDQRSKTKDQKPRAGLHAATS
jgi:four helix bundle protein